MSFQEHPYHNVEPIGFVVGKADQDLLQELLFESSGGIDLPEIEEPYTCGVYPDEGDESFATIFEVEESEEAILYNPCDYISEEKERHRRKLKLGEIHYMVAWTNGFTYDKNEKIFYKVGSRMRKAFDAGRRARNE